MVADLTWCDWSTWFLDRESESNCTSLKQKRVRCCYPWTKGNTSSRHRILLNCDAQPDIRFRLCDEKGQSSNDSLLGASNDASDDIDWYPVFIFVFIVIFTCCFFFRIWYVIKRCHRKLNANMNEGLERPPISSYDGRPSSFRSSVQTLDLRDYADILELHDVCDQRGMSYDGDESHIITDINRGSSLNLEMNTNNDAPPTYADVTAEDTFLSLDEVRPAVVNFPEFPVDVTVDVPPAYEEATMTPPPRYEDLPQRLDC